MGRVLKVCNGHIYTWKRNIVDSCGDNVGPVLTDKDLSSLKHKCLENVNSLDQVEGSAADGLVSWYLNKKNLYQRLILRSIKSTGDYTFLFLGRQ